MGSAGFRSGDESANLRLFGLTKFASRGYSESPAFDGQRLHVFGSVADLTLFAEWHSAGRGRWATNAWADDLFIAAPLAFNEVLGTEIGAGLLRDLSRNYRASS